MILSLTAGFACYYFCTTIQNKFGYDASLDAFGVHGTGGTLGALLTGVFASKAIIYDTAKSGLLKEILSSQPENCRDWTSTNMARKAIFSCSEQTGRTVVLGEDRGRGRDHRNQCKGAS
jgi:ammonia channel protein AmtB